MQRDRRSLNEQVAVALAGVVLFGQVAVGILIWSGGVFGRIGDYNYPDPDLTPAKAAVVAWLAAVAIVATFRYRVDRRAAGTALLLAAGAAVLAQVDLTGLLVVAIFESLVMLAGIALLRSPDVVYVPGLRRTTVEIGVIAAALSIGIGREAFLAGLAGLAVDPWTIAAGVIMFGLGFPIAVLSVFPALAGRVTPLLLAIAALIGLIVAREFYAAQAVLLSVAALGHARANSAARRPVITP